MNKKQYLPIINFELNKVIELFIHNEIDLYIYLSQVEGIASYKNDKFLNIIDVTGYCKLTTKYRHWPIFTSEPGKVIIKEVLEIVEPIKIYPNEWQERKLNNCFIPLRYPEESKCKALNKNYNLVYVSTSTTGKELIQNFAYAIDQKQLLIDKSQVEALKAYNKDSSLQHFSENKIDQKILEKEQKNQNYLLVKSKREHLLKKLIKKVYDQFKEKYSHIPPATEIWNILKNPDKQSDYDKDEIIQGIDAKKISWINWNGKERNMNRKTFNNYISELNNPPKK